MEQVRKTVAWRVIPYPIGSVCRKNLHGTKY